MEILFFMIIMPRFKSISFNNIKGLLEVFNSIAHSHYLSVGVMTLKSKYGTFIRGNDYLLFSITLTMLEQYNFTTNCHGLFPPVMIKLSRYSIGKAEIDLLHLLVIHTMS